MKHPTKIKNYLNLAKNSRPLASIFAIKGSLTGAFFRATPSASYRTTRPSLPELAKPSP
jgi:hypothetical protein